MLRFDQLFCIIYLYNIQVFNRFSYNWFFFLIRHLTLFNTSLNSGDMFFSFLYLFDLCEESVQRVFATTVIHRKLCRIISQPVLCSIRQPSATNISIIYITIQTLANHSLTMFQELFIDHSAMFSFRREPASHAQGRDLYCHIASVIIDRRRYVTQSSF